MHIRENIPLAPFTTFGIGGPARWFAEAAGEDDIAEAAGWSNERNIPLFVLGGGSNLLISDGGFNGLVLRIALGGITAVDGDPDGEGHRHRECILQAAAGEDWDFCVQRSVEQNWAGLECLAGIPGTVGGTPVQNVGAYGQEVASTIHRVRAFDLRERAFVELSGAECGFAYRRSRFNSADRGRFIVTRVDYRLTPGGAPTLRYADVQRELEMAGVASPTLAETADAVRHIRRSKGMLIVAGDPDCRSAGSFFKNPIVSEELLQKVATHSGPQRFSAGPGIDEKGLVKIPAAWLIEQAGFHKGYTWGAAGISTRHTLALVNRGGAAAQDIFTLANCISAAVEERFGIRLEMEPVLVGF